MRRVEIEKVGRLEPDVEVLHGHHGKVLGTRDVRDTVREPDDQVLVVDLVPVLDPVAQRVRVRAPLLRHVLARRPELLLVKLAHPQRLERELGALRNHRVVLQSQRLVILGVDLVRNRQATRVVLLVCVGNAPHTVSLPIPVVATSLGDLRLLGHKSVTQVVLLRSRSVPQRLTVRLNHRVFASVQHRVDSQREEVLVVVCVHLGRHLHTIRVGLVLVLEVQVEDTCELGLELDASIRVEVVAENVLIVGDRADHLHHQLAPAS